MNKNITRTLIAGLVCVALCGTTLARPLAGAPHRASDRAPMRHKAPPHHGGRIHVPAGHHVVHHHTPAPPPPPPLPPPPRVHHVVHHEGSGLVTLAAAVVGGIVGGIVGACN